MWPSGRERSLDRAMFSVSVISMFSPCLRRHRVKFRLVSNLEVNADTPPLALQSTTVLIYRSNKQAYTNVICNPLVEESSKL